MERYTVSAAIDKIGMTSSIFLVSLLMGFAICFDGFDYMIVSYSMPLISSEWGLDPVQTGSLSSWGTAGMMMGTFASGVLADRFGRKKVMVGFVVIFSLTTFPIILVDSYEAFCVLRLLCGLGLGSCVPVVTTMIAEYSPTAQRGRMVAMRSCFNALGYLLAGLVSSLLMPVWGWRIVYALGGLPFLYAVFLVSKMPESPYWLMSRGRANEAAAVLNILRRNKKGPASEGSRIDWQGCMLEPVPLTPGKVGFRTLFRGKYLRFTLTMAAIEFMKYFETYGINAWIPTIMLLRGYDVSTAYFMTTLQYLAGILSAVACGYGVDFFGRKWNILVGFWATALGIVLMVLADSVPLMVAANLFLGFTRSYTSVSVQPIIVETYRTEIRSTGLAFCAGVGRVAGMVSPLIGGWIMLLGFGATESLLLYSVPCIVGGLLVLFIRRDTRGVSLDELAKDYL